MNKFTWQFLLRAVETAIVAGVATFASSMAISSSGGVQDLGVAGAAAGFAALYSFIKQYGGVQALKAEQREAKKPQRY